MLTLAKQIANALCSPTSRFYMSFDLILFGGTGDLAWRKIMPALFQAHRHGTLPADGRIVGVAREDLTDGQYRNLIKIRFDQVALDKRPTSDEFEKFATALRYVRMDLSSSADYLCLLAKLQERPADVIVMYLATAPNLFITVCEQIAAAGMNGPRTRVVLEKPLGHDLASNQAINHAVNRVLTENQIFRIDHYLGKPSVQNLFALRFGNALFEPLWRRETVANVQITVAESIGIEKRGAFYDHTGALRDMVQNHALQLLCAIGMEPPINDNADSIRDEKLKVLRSLKPWTLASLKSDVVRGQYRSGIVDDMIVPGYQDEKGVRQGSTTETFVAIRAEISNWRWAGVPFYIRTGKRMEAHAAHIEVNFRPAPHTIFTAPTRGLTAANKLVINLQPRDGLELHLMAQGADFENGKVTLAPIQLDLDFDKRFGSERVGAYERLLLDVLAGRLNLFVRSDEQEMAWRWIEPVMKVWSNDSMGPLPYPAGSSGPTEATAMIAKDGYCWSCAC